VVGAVPEDNLLAEIQRVLAWKNIIVLMFLADRMKKPAILSNCWLFHSLRRRVYGRQLDVWIGPVPSPGPTPEPFPPEPFFIGPRSPMGPVPSPGPRLFPAAAADMVTAKTNTRTRIRITIFFMVFLLW
jgi:hypothetical protein